MKQHMTDGEIHKDSGIIELDSDVPQAWDNLDNKDMKIHSLMKPTLYAMAVLGSFTDGQYTADSQSSSRHVKRKQCFIFLYRLAWIILFLTILARSLVAFGYISSAETKFNGLYVLWVTISLVWFLIFWRAFSIKYGKQQAAFHTWNTSICRKFAELQLEYPVKKVKFHLKVQLVIGIMLPIFNVAGVGAQFATSQNTSYQTSPFETTWYTIIISLFFYLASSIIWIFPNMYAATISTVLKNAFSSVTKGIQDQLKTNSCKVPADFQKLRILHLQLCSLVGDFDHDLSWYYGTLCVSHVGIACFALYQILRTTLDTVTLVLYIFWAASELAILAFSTSYAATINDEAHAPLDTIYYINVSDVNLEKMAQINLFLSKLTGTQVGFSTCGLLIITKEFILTIAGVFLTYFAVLYTL